MKHYMDDVGNAMPSRLGGRRCQRCKASKAQVDVGEDDDVTDWGRHGHVERLSPRALSPKLEAHVSHDRENDVGERQDPRETVRGGDNGKKVGRRGRRVLVVLRGAAEDHRG